MEKHLLPLYQGARTDRRVSVISIPIEMGSDARGLADAPAYLYEKGLERMLDTIGASGGERKVVTCPKTPVRAAGFPKHVEEIAAVAQATCAEGGAACPRQRGRSQPRRRHPRR